MSLTIFQPRAPSFGRPTHGLPASILRFARRYRLEVSLFAGLGVTLAGLYLVFALAPAAERPAAPPAPVAAWIDVAKPLPMFDFAAPEFSRTSATTAMRRHAAGGGREDTLTLGAFAGTAAFIRFAVHQVGAEGAPDQTMFVETARRAADAGLALDGLGRTVALPTRFGQAEWADARMAAPGQAAAREGCSVFRVASDDPALRIFGMACGPDGAAFPRRQMSCLIGGLDLVAASQDDRLQKFFARSELARDAACAGPRPRAAAAPANAPKPLRAALRR